MSEGEVVWVRNATFLAGEAEFVPTEVVFESLRVVLICQITEVLIGINNFRVSVHLGTASGSGKNIV